MSKIAPAPRPYGSGGRERIRRQAGPAILKKTTGLLCFLLLLVSSWKRHSLAVASKLYLLRTKSLVILATLNPRKA